MAVRACLSEADIERLAGGDGADPESVAHAESCDACRARIADAKDDASFLARARVLAAGGLTPDVAPRIPGYRVVGVLSSGGQGVVYKGVQESTSRPVAIKVLLSGEGASARQRARAEREAEIAARLRHPNIVSVFESRRLTDGRTAVVMELIDGVPIDLWKPAGAERQRAVLRVFIGVCNGIHHAHLNGVIHRDLKPDNILVTSEGRAVVLDFGIAKAGGIRTTITGEFAGTPAYASPEQASGVPDDVDALADVYSLGVILYRLLCNAMPYEVQGSIFEIARTIREAPPASPRGRDPSIHADIEAVMLRALSKNKADRYQSAADLARDIERFLEGRPVEARSASGWYVLRKAISLNRRRLAVIGAGAAVLVGAALLVARSISHASESAREAALQQRMARDENVRARAVTELLRAALPDSDISRREFADILRSGLGRLYFRLETGAFADDPDMDLALRRLWAGVYTGLGGERTGLVEYSEVSLRNGLVKLRMQHGSEHPDIAAALHELAAVVLIRRRVPEAEAICRDALAMRTRLLGAEHPAAADTRALLARTLLAQGRDEEAAAEADKALAAFRTLPDAESDLRIGAMNAVKARVAFRAGDLEACEPLVRESLLRRLRRLSTADADLIATLTDAAELAAIFPTSGLARDMRDAYGAEGPALAEVVRADATLLAMSDPGTALRAVTTGRTEALARLLRLQETLLGPADPSLVGVLLVQMRAAAAEGKLEVKCEASLRAAQLLADRFGQDDPAVIVCLEEAASVHAMLGRPDQAAAIATRTVGIREKIPEVARDNLVLANAMRYMGWYLAQAARWDEAMSIQARSREIFESTVGAEHHAVALLKGDTAYSLAGLGRLAEADTLSREALELAERMPATHSDQLAHICFVRGHVLRRLERWDESAALLGRAWEITYSTMPEGFAWRRQLLADTAVIRAALEGQGRADAMRDWPAGW